jgi:hypothetical protein
MRFALDNAVAVVLGVWLVCTILGQFATVTRGKRFGWVRRWDYAGLIPTWTFFAPNPATADLHVVYRDRLADGTLTPWTEALFIEPRRYWHVFWNPGKRQRKVFTDLIGTLSRQLARVKARSRRKNKRRYHPLPKFLHTSLPYLAILNYVSCLPRLNRSSATQFALFRAEDGNADRARLLIVSALHEL